MFITFVSYIITINTLTVIEHFGERIAPSKELPEDIVGIPEVERVEPSSHVTAVESAEIEVGLATSAAAIRETVDAVLVVDTAFVSCEKGNL